MKNLLLLIATAFIMLFAQNAYGQTDSTYKKAPFLFAAINYSQNVASDVLPSNGFHGSLGFNVARLFKQSFRLGIMLDCRVIKVFGTNGQYNQLTEAVNASIIKNQSNPFDSTRASFLHAAFNDDPEKYFSGSYFINYGVFFCPFPNKYGSVMLQIKRGDYAFPIYGAYFNKYLQTANKNEWIDLTISTTLNVQLTCKPLTFFKSKKENQLKNNVLLSLFYETVSLKNATLDKEPLSKFLKTTFFDKYGTGHHFGFTISYGIY
jgi:hypothetical protein